jgi:hypothetical protein
MDRSGTTYSGLAYYASYMPQTFTRAELYDLVWSRPRTALAKELGVSDVAIGKHCARANVPTPAVGYWAKLSAGGKPVRLPLLLRLPGQADCVAIGKDNGHWRPVERLTEQPVPPLFVEDLEKQVAEAVKRVGRVVATRDLTAPDRSLGRVLEAEAKRRAKFLAEPRWDWHKPHFDEPAFQRHLRLFNSLARALTPLYGPQAVREDDEWFQGRGTLHHLVLHLDFGGVAMNLRVHEPGEPRRDRAPKPVSVTTLRVESSHTDVPLLEWSDGPGQKIEGSLTEIVAALLRRAEEAFRRHALWVYAQRLERYQKELAAIEQRKVEAERNRLEAVEAHKAKVRDEVVELARRRRVAEDIRATVASLRSHPEVATTEGQAQFEAWAANALAVADDMDPMSGPLVAILGAFVVSPVASQ